MPLRQPSQAERLYDQSPPRIDTPPHSGTTRICPRRHVRSASAFVHPPCWASREKSRGYASTLSTPRSRTRSRRSRVLLNCPGQVRPTISAASRPVIRSVGDMLTALVAGEGTRAGLEAALQQVPALAGGEIFEAAATQDGRG
jgi:hypothetical protein